MDSHKLINRKENKDKCREEPKYIPCPSLGSPATEREYQFASEEGAVTALSAIFFAMAAAFASVSYFLSRAEGRARYVFWLLTAFVFVFFAIDELMRIHEALGWLAGESFGPPSGFRNWNDVIVIAYGVIGLITAFCFLPEIFRYPKFVEFLTVAFVFFFVHTLIDAAIEPRTTISAILEESAKLFCASFLSFSMFVGLLGVISRRDKK